MQDLGDEEKPKEVAKEVGGEQACREESCETKAREQKAKEILKK